MATFRGHVRGSNLLIFFPAPEAFYYGHLRVRRKSSAGKMAAFKKYTELYDRRTQWALRGKSAGERCPENFPGKLSGKLSGKTPRLRSSKFRLFEWGKISFCNPLTRTLPRLWLRPHLHRTFPNDRSYAKRFPLVKLNAHVGGCVCVGG